MRNRNPAMKSGGLGKGDYKECIEPSSFTVTFFSWTGEGVTYHRGRGKMGDMNRGSKWKREVGGWGRQGLSKLKRKVDIAKNNISILLHSENSSGF